MNENNFRELNFSILGKETELEGEFKFHGDTILNGRGKGIFTVKDKSRLTLERDAKIEGEIYCHDLEIFGQFSGMINASGTLTIRSCANISGRIKAEKMSIYPGAQVNMEGHAESNDISSPPQQQSPQ